MEKHTGLTSVGSSVQRTDAGAKATGVLKFIADKRYGGMLHAKFLRSEYARAEILRMDTEDALKISGVEAVLTYESFPQGMPRFGPVAEDQPLLACKEVCYHGEPVAVVLADQEDTAAEAVKRIKVEYRELPAVGTIEEALADPGQNVCGEWEYACGDIGLGEKECVCVLQNTYTFPMVYHFALEPYACIAYPEDGGVVIESPIQHPFITRRVVGSCLGLELSAVRVVAASIGGGFGGKGYPKIEPLAAYLAMRTGRPVSIALSMQEGFFCARRLSSRVHIKTGFNAAGEIVFQEILADYLMGAYADAAPRVVAKAAYLGCGPYRTPNCRIKARVIKSNTTTATAFRGFGMPQLIWAVESQMNEAAKCLKLDLLEMRLKNLPERGEILVRGDTPVDGSWKQGLCEAARLVGWNRPKQEGLGRGIAIGIKCPIPATVSNAAVKLHADGSATVIVGCTEMGQGARTVMAQITSEILGVPVGHIRVLMGDTAAAGFDVGTVASRSTVSMGNAVADACNDLVSQVKKLAHASGMNEKAVVAEYGEIIGKGIFKGKSLKNHPLGGLADFWEIVFTAVEARVDRETGKIEITKLVNVSDVGQVINPLQAKGQEEGAGVMGLGHTLMEQMLYDSSSKLVNGGPLDYRVPTAMDVPCELLSAFIENKDGPGYFGSKGLGESGVIAVAPAVSGAVSDAVGVIIKDLPITPEKLWKALRDQDKRKGPDE